ncbi:MAG: hypothetical protein JNL90_02660 [Planctomycetes bacterium]|nr:hypothetical protein [Planctomycetota bacterium]
MSRSSPDRSMSFADGVDRAFARRRAELLHELLEDGTRVVDEVAVLAGACAADHPLAFVGTGLAAGASLAAARRPRSRSRWLRFALLLLRFAPSRRLP